MELSTARTLFLSPIYLPLLGAALILLSRSFFPIRITKVFEYLGILIGLIIPLVLIFQLVPILSEQGSIEGIIGSYESGIGISYRFDGLSLLLILLADIITFPAWIFSRTEGPKQGSFTALLLIQNASIAAISMTNDLFNLFVCLEIMGVAAYVLIAEGKATKAAYAAYSYLMASSSAMVFFLLGTFVLYRLTGSLNYEIISQKLTMLDDQNKILVQIALLLIIVPILLRVAVMPLSLWLVDAHSKAPHAVSALLSGVLLKVPLFALIRVFALSPLTHAYALPISYAGAATALIGVLFALAQSDAKKLLAYHSISQIGYIVSAWALSLHIGLDTKAGALLLVASFFHAFSHALFKALLFMTVGKATDAGKTRDVYRLRGANKALKQLGERSPLTMISFFVGALSISAIPPFNGYYSKILLTYSMKGSLQYTLLTIAAAGTVASFIKIGRIFLPQKDKKAVLVPEEEKKQNFTGVHISYLLLALACIATGIFSAKLLPFVVNLLGVYTSTNFGSAFFFSSSNLIKSAITVGAGILVFIIAILKPGQWVLHHIARFEGSFVDLFLGFALAIGALAYFII